MSPSGPIFGISGKVRTPAVDARPHTRALLLLLLVPLLPRPRRHGATRRRRRCKCRSRSLMDTRRRSSVGGHDTSATSKMRQNARVPRGESTRGTRGSRPYFNLFWTENGSQRPLRCAHVRHVSWLTLSAPSLAAASARTHRRIPGPPPRQWRPADARLHNQCRQSRGCT